MSRLRSSRASSASAKSASRAAAPAPARRPGVLVPSAKSDVFVVMLGISLAAILLGCLLMLLMLMRYEFKTKVAVLTPTPSAVSLASNFAPPAEILLN